MSYYFPDKGALLAAVLPERDHRAAEPGTHIPTKLSREDLVDYVTAVLTENIDRPGLVELHCVVSAEATSAGHPRTSTSATGTARPAAS